MSVERTPKLLYTKTECIKQVFRERQPFQNKTATPLAHHTQLTKQITSSKLATETNSAIKPKLINHVSHLSSHQNQHTPNRNIKTLIQNGSAKQESSIKKPVAKNTETRSQVLNTNHKRFNTPTPTPATRLSHLNSAKVIVSSNSKNKKEPFNPIINGVDYSDVIARKQELGYTGPGYIVEFDCDEKYLKGYTVSKGFWKLKSYQVPQKDENAMDLGPTQWLVRVETEQKTPSKNFLLNFNFGYSTTESNTPGNFKDALNFDLNTDVKKVKKHLTWFDSDKNNLESINENSSASTPQNDLTLKSPMIKDYCYSTKIESEKKRKSLRRSYSHNDLQNIILAQDDDYEVYYDNQQVNVSVGQVKLNETFELACPQSARKIHITPKHAHDVPVYDLNDSQSNDSLMNGVMSSSLSQSIDSLKINEISSLSNEFDCITAAESVNFFMNLMNIIKVSKQSNVLDGSCKIVAEDCGSYMQLSSQINQLIKFGNKCKDSLVLKKV